MCFVCVRVCVHRGDGTGDKRIGHTRASAVTPVAVSAPPPPYVTVYEYVARIYICIDICYYYYHVGDTTRTHVEQKPRPAGARAMLSLADSPRRHGIVQYLQCLRAAAVPPVRIGGPRSHTALYVFDMCAPVCVCVCASKIDG